MADLVDPSQIEELVGVNRSRREHYGRARKGTIYVMHSSACIHSRYDIIDCAFTKALEKTRDIHVYWALEEAPRILAITDEGTLTFVTPGDDTVPGGDQHYA